MWLGGTVASGQPVYVPVSPAPVPAPDARYQLGPNFDPAASFSDLRDAQGRRIEPGRGDALDSLDSSQQYRFRELLDRLEISGDDQAHEFGNFFRTTLRNPGFGDKHADVPGLCQLAYRALVVAADRTLTARYQTLVAVERLDARRVALADDRDRAAARARRRGESPRSGEAGRLSAEVDALWLEREAARGRLPEAALSRVRLRALRDEFAETAQTKARRIYDAASAALRGF